MSLYLTAADLADDAAESRLLRERAADMALQCGRQQDMFDLYAALRAEYDAAGDRWHWARLAVGHARGHARLGRQQDAIDVLEEALPMLDDGTYTAELADAAAWLGNFLTFAGRAEEANPYTEKALSVAQALGLPGSLCQALITRATALMFLDRFEEARMHVDAAVALARRHGRSDQEENALIVASDMAMTADLPEAVDYADAATALAQRRGSRYTESVAASNLLYALLYRGEWNRAEEVIAELLQVTDRPQAEYVHSRTFLLAAWRGDLPAARAALELLGPLRDSDLLDDAVVLATTDAMVANLEGRHADALRLAGDVVDRIRVSLGVRHEEVRIAWVEAMTAALAMDDLPTAENLLRRMTEVPAGFVPPYLRAESVHYAARIAAARGEADEAERLFAQAEADLDELGFRYWLARAQLDHGEWCAAQGRGQDAAALGAAAATVFGELRAEPWADRARALVGVQTPAAATV